MEEKKDYCHEMNLIAKAIRGDIELPKSEFWGYIYDCFGALNKLSYMEKNEETIRSCFGYDSVAHKETIIKKIAQRDEKGDIIKVPVLDAKGKQVYYETNHKPRYQTLYEEEEIEIEVYDVIARSTKSLSKAEFRRFKQVFDGLLEGAEDEDES